MAASLTTSERVVRSWPRWRTRLLAHLGGTTADETPDYDDIVTAAAGLAPGSLFRPSLSAMRTFDWSTVVLSAFPTPANSPPAPFWAAVGALRALGFGGPPLQRSLELTFTGLVRDAVGDKYFLPAQWFGSGAGLLVLTASEEGAYDTPPASGRPVMIVPQSRVEACAPALDFLYQSGMFEMWSGEA